MTTGRQLLFNHIPKTGGVTLRIILNRVYGEKNIFLIKSTDISASLEIFKSLLKEERKQFDLVAGHGAELFLPFMDAPFKITIFREPVSLFLSQYYYLKNTKEAGFYREVNRMESLEEYLDFAIEKGQDNLLTRYMSGSVGFLADPASPVPDMHKEGDRLLEQAKKALNEYDAVIDLDDFDAGIYALASLLKWKKIPLYRASNRTDPYPGPESLTPGTRDRLQHLLRYDLALYDEFVRSNIALGNSIDARSLGYKSFQLRQRGISILNRFLLWN